MQHNVVRGLQQAVAAKHAMPQSECMLPRFSQLGPWLLSPPAAGALQALPLPTHGPPKEKIRFSGISGGNES